MLEPRANPTNNDRRELEYELAELDAKVEGLKEYTSTERARKLVAIIRRTGAYKGEIVDLTPRQYRNLTGKIASKASLNIKGKIPWEYALDELAEDLGYRSEEVLKHAVEDVGKRLRELEQLRARRDRLLGELKKMPTKKRLPALAFKKKRLQVNGRANAYEIRSGRFLVGYILAFPPTYGVYRSLNGLDIRERPIGGATSLEKAKDIARRKIKRLTRIG